MLYQDKEIGHPSGLRRLRAWVGSLLRGRQPADLDLLAMSPHLKRDLGLLEGCATFRTDVRLRF